MKKTILLISIAFILSLTGCSARMALIGNSRLKEPNLSLITKGQGRRIIESQPLKPLTTITLENGNLMSTYDIKIGNSPSAARAIKYITLDLFTLGIAEPFQMIYEYQGGKHTTLQIEYSPAGEVVRVY